MPERSRDSISGRDDALLGNYAWYKVNSGDRTWPVASLKPNDFGLFDMLGNVWQWCECSAPGLSRSRGLAVADDSGSNGKVTNDIRRVLRGGAYNNLPRHVRAAYRVFQNPDTHNASLASGRSKRLTSESHDAWGGLAFCQRPIVVATQVILAARRERGRG